MKTVLCYGDSNTYGFRPGTDGERYSKETFIGIYFIKTKRFCKNCAKF